MNRSLIGLLATALVAVACVQGGGEPETAGQTRLDLLATALAERASDPPRVLDLVERAGAGAGLEHLRLELWLESLERVEPPPERWRRFLAEEPPAELRGRATAGLARALVAAGESAAALVVLEAAAGDPETDLALLELARGPTRARALRRLAVHHPRRLGRVLTATEERRLVEALPRGEQLRRGQRWLELGEPRRVTSELGGRRFADEDERRRRRLVAEALIARGRPAQALATLPGDRDPSPADLVLRAAAERRQGWQRHPKPSGVAAFDRCRRAAERALAAAGDDPTRSRAAALVVECATESGRPEAALAAWTELVSLDQSVDNLDWIGRRWGVALALAGREREALAVARSLPDQARCLSYWGAAAGGPGVAALAAAPVADLYALWAREDLGLEPPEPAPPVPPLGSVGPPRTVSWLLDRGAETEASAEWQRLRARRLATPAEALAAARFEHGRGRVNLSIRILRASFSELGGIDLLELPEDVVRAYLPLRWPEALVAAAREAGVAPWLVAGLARQESVFTATARSPRGAMGVLQLIPGTARIHARALGLGAAPDLTDPELNLRLGAREIAALLADFGALEPALAAYNAGPTRARRWWRQWPDRRRFTEEVPIPETYTYIRRVTFLAEAYRQAYAGVWRESS